MRSQFKTFSARIQEYRFSISVSVNPSDTTLFDMSIFGDDADIFRWGAGKPKLTDLNRVSSASYYFCTSDHRIEGEQSGARKSNFGCVMVPVFDGKLLERIFKFVVYTYKSGGANSTHRGIRLLPGSFYITLKKDDMLYEFDVNVRRYFYCLLFAHWPYSQQTEQEARSATKATREETRSINTMPPMVPRKTRLPLLPIDPTSLMARRRMLLPLLRIAEPVRLSARPHSSSSSEDDNNTKCTTFMANSQQPQLARCCSPLLKPANFCFHL